MSAAASRFSGSYCFLTSSSISASALRVTLITHVLGSLPPAYVLYAAHQSGNDFGAAFASSSHSQYFLGSTSWCDKVLARLRSASGAIIVFKKA